MIKKFIANKITIKTFKYVNELKYHKSWDWLMPVIEKIQDVQGSRVGIMGTTVYFEKGDKWWESGSKIESAYNFAVEYIEWYNKQKIKPDDTLLLPCPLCGSTSFFTADMDIISSTEAAEAIISCNRCAYTLTDEGVLLEELITNHNTRFSVGEK